MQWSCRLSPMSNGKPSSFFIGLFILVGGLVTVGVIRYLADQLVALTEGNLAESTMAVLWGSAIFLAALDNIPYVASMN